MEQVADVGRVFPGDAQFFPHFLVVVLSQRLGGFDAQAMQIEVARVLPVFEQALGFPCGFGTDRDQRDSENIELAGRLGREEIGDGELAALFLAGEGEASKLMERRASSPVFR